MNYKKKIYHQFRFAWTGESTAPNVQCVLCYQTLPNSYLVESKDEPLMFLEHKYHELKNYYSNLMCP